MKSLRHRLTSVLLVIMFLAVLLPGCGQKETVPEKEPAKAELEVWTFVDKNVPGAY